MATIQRFEDLIAWQKARVLARNVYVVTREESFSRDFGLASQGTEGCGVGYGESRGRLRTAAAAPNLIDMSKSRRLRVRRSRRTSTSLGMFGYVDSPRFEVLQEQLRELQRILAGLKASLAPEPRASGRGPRN